MNLSNEDFLQKYEEILNKFNKIHSLTNYKNINSIFSDSIEMLYYLADFTKICDKKFDVKDYKMLHEILQKALCKKFQLIIDIGSGAGIPAVFLAFFLDKSEFHLFEPNMKKSSFLIYLKTELNMQNITIHQNKIQDCQCFKADLITSRAVCKTKELIEISKGFWNENTIFALYKGSEANAEISDLQAKIKTYKQDLRTYLFLSDLKCKNL